MEAIHNLRSTSLTYERPVIDPIDTPAWKLVFPD